MTEVGSVLDLPVFAGLGEAEATSFAEHATTVVLAAGDTLFRQGDRGSSLYLLLTGQIEVVGDDDRGGGHRLAVLERGAILGEVAVLIDAPRTATAVAVTDARLWEVGHGSFQTGLDASHTWAVALLRTIGGALAERLATVDRRLLELISAERTSQGAATGGQVAELERLRRRLLSDWSF